MPTRMLVKFSNGNYLIWPIKDCLSDNRPFGNIQIVNPFNRKTYLATFTDFHNFKNAFLYVEKEEV